MPYTLNKVDPNKPCIEVATEFKHLQIRELTDTGGYHRRVLTSDQTLADDEHQDIKDKAEELWTAEVTSA